MPSLNINLKQVCHSEYKAITLSFLTVRISLCGSLKVSFSKSGFSVNILKELPSDKPLFVKLSVINQPGQSHFHSML